ncbi:hypothetical protein C8Q79DRAFT_943254 [Trametes meyenii]|nr:hypothetical protein C8Q79DRAFT_943254 [Trametes meyenii]
MACLRPDHDLERVRLYCTHCPSIPYRSANTSSTSHLARARTHPRITAAGLSCYLYHSQLTVQGYRVLDGELVCLHTGPSRSTAPSIHEKPPTPPVPRNVYADGPRATGVQGIIDNNSSTAHRPEVEGPRPRAPLLPSVQYPRAEIGSRGRDYRTACACRAGSATRPAPTSPTDPAVPSSRPMARRGANTRLSGPGPRFVERTSDRAGVRATSRLRPQTSESGTVTMQQTRTGSGETDTGARAPTHWQVKVSASGTRARCTDDRV